MIYALRTHSRLYLTGSSAPPPNSELRVGESQADRLASNMGSSCNDCARHFTTVYQRTGLPECARKLLRRDRRFDVVMGLERVDW